MKKIATFLISCYQKTLSPDTGVLPRILGLSKKTCMFYPSCSEYTKIAINRHGIFKGVYLGILRISRCNPWNSPSVDEVPD